MSRNAMKTTTITKLINKIYIEENGVHECYAFSETSGAVNL